MQLALIHVFITMQSGSGTVLVVVDVVTDADEDDAMQGYLRRSNST